MDLNLGRLEFEAVEKWLNNLPFDKGKSWIGVGPGSKMPAKVWPLERFRRVVASLIEEFDIWPVIFGGPEDHDIGAELLHQWGRGYNAAGVLDVREAAAALMKAQIYVGNDTGTMHLAVANDVPCVAIFTARDAPGHFFPYGQGHIVHRKVVECEGCMLEECVANDMKCIRSVTVEEVIASCRSLMLAANRRKRVDLKLFQKANVLR